MSIAVAWACLTLTELPVLGDHLAVAAVAVAGVGAVAVHALALAFTGVVLTLIHIYKQRHTGGEAGFSIRDLQYFLKCP